MRSLESIDKLYDKNSNTFLTQTGEEDQIENEYTKNLSNIPNNNLNDETGQIGESINSFSMMENNNNLSLNNLSSTIKQKKEIFMKIIFYHMMNKFFLQF